MNRDSSLPGAMDAKTRPGGVDLKSVIYCRVLMRVLRMVILSVMLLVFVPDNFGIKAVVAVLHHGVLSHVVQ